MLGQEKKKVFVAYNLYFLCKNLKLMSHTFKKLLEAIYRISVYYEVGVLLNS